MEFKDIRSAAARKAYEENLLNGQLAGKLSMGYKFAYEENSKKRIIIIDNDIAPLIQKAYELYATNKYSAYKICQILNDPRLHRKRLIRILKNPFYCGFMQSKGTLYEHKYPKLITKELFDKVSDLISKNFICKPKKEISFLFKSLISCNICGHIISGLTVNGHRKYIYYACNYPDIHPRFFVDEAKLLFLIEKRIKEINTEIWDYFLISDHHTKRLIISFIFKNLKLQEKELLVEIWDRDYSLENLKKHLNNYLNKKSNDPISIEDDHDKDHDNIFLNLCKKPTSIESLVDQTGLSLMDIQSELLDLQMDDKIDQDENGLWRTK